VHAAVETPKDSATAVPENNEFIPSTGEKSTLSSEAATTLPEITAAPATAPKPVGQRDDESRADEATAMDGNASDVSDVSSVHTSELSGLDSDSDAGTKSSKQKKATQKR
jgi:hypothetical protein